MSARVGNGLLPGTTEAIGRAILQTSPDCIVVLTGESRVIEWNPAAERTFGYAAHEALGRNLAELIIPERLRRQHKLLGAQAASEAVQRLEFCAKRRDGSEFEAVLSLRAVPNADEALFIAYVRDISGSSEERHRLAARATNDAIWDWDLVNQRVEWNEAVETLFHYTLSQVDSTPGWWEDRIHPQDRERIVRSIHAAIASPTAANWQEEYRFRRADGRYAEVLDRGFLMRDHAGRPVRMVGAMLDQTERNRSARALAQSEARYRLLAENATDMIVRTDKEGVRRYISPACREILGFEPAELVGSRLVDVVHPEDRELVESGLDQLFSGRIRSETVTYRVPHRDGHWVWLEARRRLMREEQDRPPEVVSVVRDVTRRRELEERLRQSQKMEAIGQLTGGVAHDFNNLLQVIIGNGEELAEELASPEHRVLAETILEAALHGAALNQQLLAFARRQALKPEPLVLDEVVHGMMGLLKRSLGEHIEIRTAMMGSKSAALTDRALLGNAILNLAVNARDAMPSGGTLTITTGERFAGPKDGNIPVGQPVVFLTVTDTGAGMAPQVLNRVFEPFFTTKDVGKGSGLGLSMVYGFAEQSGGHVSIASAEGQGTSVTILLRAVGAETSDATATIAQVKPGTGERVLVVEDEPAVRGFVSMQLRAMGYQVEAVESGPEALDILERAGPVDLLFTDIVLPKGISGVDLARRARELRPGLKVLLTSGYSEEVFEHHGRPDKDLPLLRKPYRRKELGEALRSILDT